MAERGSTVRQQSLHVWNSTASPLTLFLEPWAEEYTLAPESGVDLVGDGPTQGRFEVSVQDNGIAVYGWTASDVQVFKDGAILEPFTDESRVNSTKAKG